MGVLLVPPSALQTGGGDPDFLDDERDTTPNVEQTIFDFTVAAGKKRLLTAWTLSCGFDGVGRVFLNDSLIETLITGAGGANGAIYWVPERPLVEDDNLKVKYLAVDDSPVVSVRNHLMFTEQDV